MVGLINLGAGLSQMGQGIADVGTTGLKNALDNQKLILANQLAGARETALAHTTGQESRQTAAFENELPTSPTVKAQLASQEKIATAHDTTSTAIAKMQTAAEVKDTAMQIAANSKEISIDSDTGNAVITDRQTGKSTPLLGANGQPFRPVNPAQAQLAISAINSANEQLRNVYLQRGQDISAARSAYNDAVTMSGGDVDSPKAKTAKQALDAVSSRYDGTIATLSQQITSYTAQLYGKSAMAPGQKTAGPAQPPQPMPAAPGQPGQLPKPPLSSFLNQPAQ